MITLGTFTEAPTAWLWVSRFGEIHFRGQSMDMGADADDFDRHRVTADTAERSLSEWYRHHQPPLIREHSHKGHSDGVATGQTRRLSPGQMEDLITPEMLPEHAAKIRAQTDDGFFAEFRLTDPDTARQYRNGQLLYTSPHVIVAHKDDEGTVWPVIHLENSLTTGPVQTTQIPMTALMEARLSHGGSEMTDTTEAPKPVIELAEGAPDVMARLEAILPALEALVTAQGELAEDPPVADQPTEEDEAKDAELSKVKAALSAVQATLASVQGESRRKDAEVTVAKLSLTEPARVKLVAMAVSNPEGFALSIAHVPALAADQPVGAFPVGAGEVIGDESGTPEEVQHRATLSHQKARNADGASLSYNDALGEVRAQTNEVV